MTLPNALYNAAQARELDRLAIEQYGIPGGVLMQRAGEAAFMELRRRWPRARRIVVICGPGNNGGDGCVLARLAGAARLAPVVLCMGDTAALRGDAATAFRECRAAGIEIRDFDASRLQEVEVIVDALFGTGLERKIAGKWRAAIEAVNGAQRPVLAIDLPSGLHADTGRILGAAVRAQATMTFIGLKAGMFTAAGPDCCGEISFADLGVPQDVYASIPPAAMRLEGEALSGLLPRRARDSHKGDFGRVLVIGGDLGMAGAARLAGEGAYRAGAGLVYVATHPGHAAHMSAARPELLAHGVVGAQALKRLLQRATVIAIGPGLGQANWGKGLWRAALASGLPLVVDADGLNLLAGGKTRRDDWILTPHPGEAARLLGCSTADIQSDRFAAAHEIVAHYGGVCVLKGAGTLVAAAEPPLWLCDRGNPGMAGAGMGDVLTGAIAALRAQGLRPVDAARLGVWVHAAAGDDAAGAEGETGLMASDLLVPLRAHLNRLSVK